MNKLQKQLIQSLLGGPWFRWVIALAICFEFYLILSDRNAFGYYASPVLLMLSSLTIGLLPILLSGARRRIPREVPPMLWPHHRPWLVFGLFALGIFLCTPRVATVLTDFPPILEKTDIIHILGFMVDRLLGTGDGQPVYAEYLKYGYPFNPTWLPMKWLPFVAAEWLGIDYRWVPYVIFLGGLFFYFLWLNRQNWSLLWTLLAAIAPFYFLYEITLPHQGYETRTILAYCIEYLSVGYYLFLAYALLQGGLWVRSTGFLLTLLGRFTHLFWVPWFFIAAFFKESKKKTFYTALIIGVGIFLIYVLPFLSQDWQAFSKGQEQYSRAAVGAWKLGVEPDIPYAMKHGLGMAIYLYDATEGESLQERVAFARNFLLAISILSGLLVGLGFYFVRNRMAVGYYFLFGLKAYFAIFYAFVQVPYPYLYIVPLYFSLFVLLAAGKGIFGGPK